MLTHLCLCLSCLCLQVKSALNAASQLCSQDSVFESPTHSSFLECGYDVNHLHPAYYQQTKSAPTSHEML